MLEHHLPRLTWLPEILSICLGVVFLVFIYLVSRRLILPVFEKLTFYISPKNLALLKVHYEKLNRRLAVFICSLVFVTSFHYFYLPGDGGKAFYQVLGQVIAIIYGGLIFSSSITISGAAYNQLSFAKDVPIYGIIQVFKLLTFIVTAILIISILMEKSPAYILSGFGALAAMLLLVFKDTILGFVASIQIAANHLVKNGDWVQFDQYGANGEIIELGLNTVKVRNWDKTITTVPTYTLISESFKNWRGMEESGGRRIKRALNLDLNSITIVESATIDEIKTHQVITQILDQGQLDEASGKSNVRLFRMYAEAYLKQHQELNQELTLMVRELDPHAEGLPIEIYCFSTNKNWVPYEHLQADLIDHLLAILPLFGLRPYQHVTGQLSGQPISQLLSHPIKHPTEQFIDKTTE
jgi:miniconductance mechanosensitive channel